jgi:MFS superfamily sulfate permease-like transporter
MSDMDMTGAATLTELTNELRGQDVDVHLARLHATARDVADRSGLMDAIGPGHSHVTVREAVRAATPRREST